jgi:hypothetical protein
VAELAFQWYNWLVSGGRTGLSAAELASGRTGLSVA